MTNPLNQIFSLLLAQTNGVLDSTELQNLMDEAYNDYNYGSYPLNPPLYINGIGNAIGYYGPGYGDPQVGQQLYDGNGNLINAAGATYTDTSNPSLFSEVIQNFDDKQLNGGTFRFIGWNSSGIVVNVIDITIPSSVTPTPTQTVTQTPTITLSSTPTSTPTPTPTTVPQLNFMANTPIFRFNNSDILNEFNNSPTLYNYSFGVEKTVSSNGLLDVTLLQSLMDAAYEDYNYGSYPVNPPLYINGVGNTIGYYGSGINNPQVGEQLYGYNGNAYNLGAGGTYVPLVSTTTMNDMNQDFGSKQLNGGTFRFIAWNSSGVVTDIQDITVPSSVTPTPTQTVTQTLTPTSTLN